EMRSRFSARAARSVRASSDRLSHEQEALEHGRNRQWNFGGGATQNDQPFLRASGQKFAEEDARKIIAATRRVRLPVIGLRRSPIATLRARRAKNCPAHQLRQH